MEHVGVLPAGWVAAAETFLCLKTHGHAGKTAQGTSPWCGIDSLQSVGPTTVNFHVFLAQLFHNTAHGQHLPTI